MGETVQQIAAQIDSSRERLGSNLEELERRVDAVTDWRSHFRTRPMAVMGAAFAGGALLATTMRGRPRGRRYAPPSSLEVAPHEGTAAQKHQALETWDNIKGALIGLAATRFKDYLGELLPGFAEQFQRTERKAESLRTTAT